VYPQLGLSPHSPLLPASGSYSWRFGSLSALSAPSFAALRRAWVRTPVFAFSSIPLLDQPLLLDGSALPAPEHLKQLSLASPGLFLFGETALNSTLIESSDSGGATDAAAPVPELLTLADIFGSASALLSGQLSFDRLRLQLEQPSSAPPAALSPAVHVQPGSRALLLTCPTGLLPEHLHAQLTQQFHARDAAIRLAHAEAVQRSASAGLGSGDGDGSSLAGGSGATVQARSSNRASRAGGGGMLRAPPPTFSVSESLFTLQQQHSDTHAFRTQVRVDLCH
jgi:hypothetical protein